MTFEDAIKKAVKAYFEGHQPDSLDKATTKKRKYTKDYFDKMGETETSVAPSKKVK